jgi:hypothetical protein
MEQQELRQRKEETARKHREKIAAMTPEDKSIQKKL